MAHDDSPLDFRDFDELYAWLAANHDRVERAELFMYKKGHEHEGITYEDAVRAAVCWGWIDSITHRHDEVRFRQRFTPRKAGSNWSASNIERVIAMLEAGKMTEAGLRTFDMALVQRLDEVREEERKWREGPTELPAFARAKLESDATVLAAWERLPPSHKRNYVRWIMDAKREATRVRRVDKMMTMLSEGRSQSEL